MTPRLFPKNRRMATADSPNNNLLPWRPAFRLLLEIATTGDASGVSLINEVPSNINEVPSNRESLGGDYTVFLAETGER